METNDTRRVIADAGHITALYVNGERQPMDPVPVNKGDQAEIRYTGFRYEVTVAPPQPPNFWQRLRAWLAIHLAGKAA